MHLLMTDVGFEPVRMRRRRLALRCMSSLPTALPRLPKKQESSDSTIKGLRPSHYTPFIGVLFMFLLTNSMNYIFSLSNGSDSCLYNHTGDLHLHESHIRHE